MTLSKVVFSRKSDEWRTPKDLFKKLDQEFYFTLDAACTKSNCLCKKGYTKKQNGLTRSWSGERVWVNPPYSSIKEWVAKAWESAHSKNTRIVMLVPARTDTRWFHAFCYGIEEWEPEIRFIKGRLKFSGSKNSAPFPSMLLIWE